MNIVQLTAETLPLYRQALAALMVEAVKNNMTSAFQHSQKMQQYQDAERYFHSLRNKMARHELLLWIAVIDSVVVGSVQLNICQRPDGQNRAEVLQLLVHSNAQ